MNLKMHTLRKLNANNDVVSINIDDQQVNIPYFLIEITSDKIHNRSINLALKFIGKYLEKKILIPNNLTFFIIYLLFNEISFFTENCLN